MIVSGSNTLLYNVEFVVKAFCTEVVGKRLALCELYLQLIHAVATSQRVRDVFRVS